MANIWKIFDDLLPKDPLLIGTVTAYGPNDTSYVSYLGGGTAVVRGQSVAVDSKAFISGNQIQGEAPDLPAYSFEV